MCSVADMKEVLFIANYSDKDLRPRKDIGHYYLQLEGLPL
jgi:hypothetical protein